MRQGLGLEGYLLHGGADGWAISGGEGAPRGAIYGAHAFAESLGVRFLAPNATLSPNNGTDPEMGASRQLDKASHAHDYTHQ